MPAETILLLLPCVANVLPVFLAKADIPGENLRTQMRFQVAALPGEEVSDSPIITAAILFRLLSKGFAQMSREKDFSEYEPDKT